MLLWVGVEESKALAVQREENSTSQFPFLPPFPPPPQLLLLKMLRIQSRLALGLETARIQCVCSAFSALCAQAKCILCVYLLLCVRFFACLCFYRSVCSLLSYWAVCAYSSVLLCELLTVLRECSQLRARVYCVTRLPSCGCVSYGGVGGQRQRQRRVEPPLTH